MAKIDCAVILAGGKGVRLQPLTTNRPKPLVPVALIPMIDFAINQIKDAGITKIIIAVKYLGDQIRRYIEESPKFKDLEIIIPDIDPIGTADAVRKVSEYIHGNFVVSMADIVSNISIKKMIEFFNSTQAFATISLKNIDFPTKKFGVILLDEKQNIEIFLEKPKPEEMLFTTIAFAHRPVAEFHQNLVNTGVYIFNHKVLEILDSFKDIDDFGQELFPYLLQEKFKLNGYVGDYYWLDCGQIRSYLWANYDILRGFIDGYYPPGNKREDSWFGENSQISESVKIIPPVVIGNNVIIEDNSVIGPYSIIHSDVVIKEKSTIDQSVIWENVTVGRNSFIKESVICDNVKLEDDKRVTNYSAIG